MNHHICKYLHRVALLFCLLLTPITAQAQEEHNHDHSAKETPQSRAIWKQLICQCPTCNKQALDQCHSGCHDGQEMRTEVNAMLSDGKDSASVIQAFYEKYGAVVLGSPPEEGFGLLARWVPLSVLALSVVPLWLFTRSRRSPKPTKSARGKSQSPTTEDARVEAALRDYDY